MADQSSSAPKRQEAPNVPSTDPANAEKPPEVATVINPSGAFQQAQLKAQAVAAGNRFVILRPHAKGGLGEVLVAEDQELHREVAYKRIQPQRATDDDARRRFLLEAEITAKLEHPGIVPIYGLVHDENGQPCYAMRFIEGESLKEAIAQFHKAAQPWDGIAFRQLLQRFITVCQTMAYAHSRGIIHRDLKPANVMLGKFGETLVVDWGLAKRFGRTDVERTVGEPSLTLPPTEASDETQMGQVVGTPSYMSPEQAGGRWNIVGPVSDVYSLGAILYEMLTGRLPVQGQDAYETLAQVQRGEFQRPRHWRSDVPRSLEAICLRAMALDAGKRYETAATLAKDVEQWLARETVMAYREPWWEQAARWLRRHRALATGAVAAAVVAAGFLVVLNLLSERQNAALRLANSYLEQEQEHTQANLAFAREALDDMTSYTLSDLLSRQTRLTSSHKAYLKRALDRYERFKSETGASEASRARVAAAYFRAAMIRQRLLELQDATNDYRRALGAYASLGADFSTDPEYRRQQAMCHWRIGQVSADLGQRDEALAETTKAVDLQEQLIASFPGDRTYLKECADVHHYRSTLLYELTKWNDAETEVRQAIAIRAKLAADGAGSPTLRQDLAESQRELAEILVLVRNAKAAILEYDQALAVQNQLLREDPTNPTYQQGLAATQTSLGGLFLNLGQHDKAETHFRGALSLYEKLVSTFPAVPIHRQNLASCHTNLGAVALATARREIAEKELRLALAIQEQMAGDYPEVVSLRQTTASSYFNLAKTLTSFGRPEDALPLYDKTISMAKEMLARDERLFEVRVLLRNAHGGRAEALVNSGRYADAAPEWERAGALSAEMKAERMRLWFRANYVMSLARAGDHAKAVAEAEALAANNDVNGEVLLVITRACAIASAAAKGDAKLADQYAARAVAILRQAIAKGFRDAESLKKDNDLKPLREREDFKKLLKDLAP